MQDERSAESPRITATQWRLIVNSAVHTAIISLDRQGRITSWSAGATRLLGWSEAEMIGKTLERVFPPGSDQLEREIAAAIAHGRGGGEEGWRLRKDGTRIWGSGEVAPIRDGKEIVGFVKILRDRTQQRETEEAVREERRALEVLNRAGSALAVL